MQTPLRVVHSRAIEVPGAGLRVKNLAFYRIRIHAILAEAKWRVVLIVAILSIAVAILSLKVRAQSPSTSTATNLEEIKVPQQIQQIEHLTEGTHKEELRELTKQLRELYKDITQQLKTSEETRNNINQKLKTSEQARDSLAQKLKYSEQARDYYKKMFERYDNKWEHLFLDWKLTPQLTQTIDRSPTRGPEHARHAVIIYSDFQSPVCREFETWFTDKIQPIAKRNGGVKVVFKYWPICTDCNPKATRNLHPAACRAALSAEAANMVGGNDAFWRMHDMLFATQDQWSDKYKWKEFKFETYAKQIGLDVDRFIQAMNSDEAMQHVKADLTQGSNLGKELLSDKFKEADRQAVIVDSTPAVYIDNKKLAKWSMAHTWLEILKLPAPEAGATPAPATAPQ